MADSTGISWTDHTWNPWIGCTKVSPGCTNCYAEEIVEVFPMAKGKGAFKTLVRSKTWGDPLKWNRAAAAAGRRELVFTCSMSDFFHPDADAWRAEAWATIKGTPNLEYQILTKRPERIGVCLPSDWGPDGYPNVWLGTSIENQKYADLRIPQLLTVGAKLHFLSCEPLLGPLKLAGILGEVLEYFPAFNEVDGVVYERERYQAMKGIDWVIVGGESGPNHRQMMTQWAIDIKAQCDAAGVPFFGKQRSGPKNELPLIMNGREWKAMPAGFEARHNAPFAGAGQLTLGV